MESRNNTRKVVEAGLLVALTLVIAVFVNFVPLIGVIGVAALPIPIALLYIKYDIKLALTSLAASVILISVTMGIQEGVRLGSIYVTTGLVLGYCFKNKVRVSKSIFLLGIAFIIGTALNISFLLLFIDKNFFVNSLNMTIDIFKESFERSAQLTGQGAGNPQFDQMKQLIDNLNIDLFLYLLPGALVISGFLAAVMNYTITRNTLKRLRYEVQEITTFDKFYVDNRLGAIIIIVTCLGIILDKNNMVIGKYLHNSGSVIMSSTFIIVGSAVVYYYARNKFNMGKTTAVIVTIALAMPPMSMFVTYIGLADMIFDFRKVDPNRLFKSKK